jgi:hypothetical protein
MVAIEHVTPISQKQFEHFFLVEQYFLQVHDIVT